MTRLFLLLALLIGQGSHASTLNFKDTSLSADIGFAGNYVDDKQVEARVFGMKANLYVDQKLSETLSGKLGAGASLETGSNNSLVINEYRPERKWILIEGYLDWKPFDFLNFKAGAINQKEYKSYLLVGSTAFLATQEQVTFAISEAHKFYFKMEQAIPNNENLADRIGSVDEGTPGFYIETIGMDLDGDIAAIKIEASQWAFNTLSNGVAYSSRFSGNTITGSGSLNSEFAYKFKGYNLMVDSEFHLGDFVGLALEGQYLYNDKAPNNRNTGRIVYAGLLLGNHRIFAEQFEIQSDVSPAYYNSKHYGHNNKEGHSFGFGGEYDNGHLVWEIRYTKSTPIKSNIFQSDTSKVYLKLTKDLDF